MPTLGTDVIVAFKIVNEGDTRVDACLGETSAGFVDTLAAVDEADEV